MDGDVWIKKAYEAILANDFEQAIEWFQQAINAEPDNATYYYRLSITYARSGKLTKAFEHAETACQLSGGNMEYVYHLRNIHSMLLVQEAEKSAEQSPIHADKVIAALKQAVVLDPLSIKGYLLLAEVYSELNDYIHAIQYVKEVLKLYPDHELAVKLLAQYEFQLKQKLRRDK